MKLLIDSKICFSTASMFSLAVSSSIVCSIKNRDKKNELLNNYRDFDLTIEKSFNSPIDYKDLEKKCLWAFAACYFLSVIMNGLFSASGYGYGFSFFLYGVQISVLSHMVHMEMFQAFLFVWGIQIRLNIVSNELVRLQGNLKSEPQKIMELKQIFIKLYELQFRFNDVFKFPLLLNLLELYSSLLIDLYWLAIGLFGVPYANAFGKFSIRYVNDAKDFMMDRSSCYIFLATLHSHLDLFLFDWQRNPKNFSENNLSTDIISGWLRPDGRVSNTVEALQVQSRTI